MDINEKLTLFERETGIWPPGRDMPAVMCGGEDIRGTRRRAYDYWYKTQTIRESLELEVGFVKKANEQLQAEKQAYRNALENMGFCKRHICENCRYVKELTKRCVNEQIRDEVFHKQALEE